MGFQLGVTLGTALEAAAERLSSAVDEPGGDDLCAEIAQRLRATARAISNATSFAVQAVRAGASPGAALSKLPDLARLAVDVFETSLLLDALREPDTAADPADVEGMLLASWRADPAAAEDVETAFEGFQAAEALVARADPKRLRVLSLPEEVIRQAHGVIAFGAIQRLASSSAADDRQVVSAFAEFLVQLATERFDAVRRALDEVTEPEFVIDELVSADDAGELEVDPEAREHYQRFFE